MRDLWTSIVITKKRTPLRQFTLAVLAAALGDLSPLRGITAADREQFTKASIDRSLDLVLRTFTHRGEISFGTLSESDKRRSEARNPKGQRRTVRLVADDLAIRRDRLPWSNKHGPGIKLGLVLVGEYPAAAGAGALDIRSPLRFRWRRPMLAAFGLLPLQMRKARDEIFETVRTRPRQMVPRALLPQPPDRTLQILGRRRLPELEA